MSETKGVHFPLSFRYSKDIDDVIMEIPHGFLCRLAKDLHGHKKAEKLAAVDAVIRITELCERFELETREARDNGTYVSEYKPLANSKVEA